MKKHSFTESNFRLVRSVLRSYGKRNLVFLLIAGFSFLASCQSDESKVDPISQDDLAQIKALGFSVEGIQDIGDYYLVERDVMLKKDRLKDYKTTLTFPLTIPNGRVDQARGTI